MVDVPVKLHGIITVNDPLMHLPGVWRSGRPRLKVFQVGKIWRGGRTVQGEPLPSVLGL